MEHYLTSFVTYTFAMAGMLLIALCVYKRVTANIQKGKRSDFLSLEHRLDLSQRKSILVVRAGNERFLLASDAENTSLIAKLNIPKKALQQPEQLMNQNSYSDYSYSNNTDIKTFSLEEEKIPVLQSMMSRAERSKENR